MELIFARPGTYINVYVNIYTPKDDFTPIMYISVMIDE